MKRFSKHAEEEWGDFLDVKLSDTPIRVDKLSGASVLLGSVTDAYNPYEKKYEITSRILRQFIGSKARVEILTKSDLVTRDIEILKQIPDLRVGISMNTLDDFFRRKTEPFAATVSRRIDAMKVLHEAGIRTYLFMSPIFPEITRFVEIIEKTKPFADSFYFENLNLRASYMPRVLNFIAQYAPEYLDIYKKIYKKKETAYWESLSTAIHQYSQKAGLDYKLYFYHEKIKKAGKTV
jgi:DNA repair photolyase